MHHARVVALTLLALAGAPGAARAEVVTFVHANELYSIEAEDGRGGLLKFAAIVRRLRAERPHVVVTHGGDAISPSLMSSFDDGAHMIDLLNHLAIDAMALGNHEFDFGLAALRKRLREAAFPILSANARERDGAPLRGLGESMVFTRAGVTIGLYALIKPGAQETSSSGAARFDPPLEAAAREAAALRARGAEFIVALAHLERADDEALRVSGHADLILGGDDRELLARHDGETALLVESQQGAEVVAVVDVAFSRGDDGALRWRPTVAFHDSFGVAPDPGLQGRAQRYLDRLAAALDEPIGRLPEAMDSRRRTVRTEPAAIGALIAEAMRVAMNAEIGLTNGGGIRGDRVYAAGHPITRRDVLTELPFRNTTALLAITGRDLRAALENGVSAVEEMAGRFPQTSGLRFAFDPAAPPGRRLGAVFVGDRPLEDDRVYRLATNSFIALGGDGYEALKRARVLRLDASDYMDQHVIAHLKRILN